MVVIDKFKVTIELDGKECVEYNDEELDNAASESHFPCAARYIEALPDRKFAVIIHVLPGFGFCAGSNSLLFNVYLDGIFSNSKVLHQDEYLQGRVNVTVKDKRTNHDGQWKSNPYVFSELDITQDNIKGDPRELKAKYGLLGTIQIKAQSLYVSGHHASVGGDRGLPATEKSVSEKALKGRAVTLGAGYGAATPCQQPRDYDGVVVNDKPLAFFTFHHRTKKALQDLMIIPRDDNGRVAAEVDSDDDIENMTAEELRLMLRQQMKKKATHVKPGSKLAIKREIQIHDLDDDDGDEDILEIRETKRSRITTEVIEID